MHKAISAASAAEMIPDEASVMIGGFMGVGSPHRIIAELVRQGRKNLTIIANDSGRPRFGIGLLIVAKLVRRLIASHIGTNPETQRQMIAGELDVELCPQGTLLSACGPPAMASGRWVTPTGIGTMAADGKRTIEVEGRTFLPNCCSKPISRCWGAKRADYYGNLDYSLTALKLQPVDGDGRRQGDRRSGRDRARRRHSARRGGDPAHIGGSRDREGSQSWTIRKSLQGASPSRCGQAIWSIGIGLPAMVANDLAGRHLGVLPVGERDHRYAAGARGRNEDPDPTDAGGNFIGAIPGACSIDSALSFGP